MSHDDLAQISLEEQRDMARRLGTQRTIIGGPDYIANVQLDVPKTGGLLDFTYTHAGVAAHQEELVDGTSPYRLFTGFLSRLFGRKQPPAIEIYDLDPEEVEQTFDSR